MDSAKGMRSKIPAGIMEIIEAGEKLFINIVYFIFIIRNALIEQNI